MHQPVLSTPRHQLEQQHARPNALEKLQVQRLQRAEQRLHGKLQGSADAAPLHDQVAGHAPPSPPVQQLAATKKVSGKFNQQQAAQQQHIALQSQGQQQMLSHALCKQHGTATVVRCITTTAGRGMQSRPPSRGGSVRSSVELHQQQQLNTHDTGGTRAGRTSSALATAAPYVAHAQTSQTAADPKPTQQLVPQLQIQGMQLRLQQQQHMAQLSWHNKTNTRCAAVHKRHQQQQEQGRALQTLLVCTTHNNSRGALCVQLGCGVAWPDFASKAELVAGRSFYYTKQEREQHRLQLAKVVVQQWAWFTCARQQARRAIQHKNRRLLLAGWLGLQQEASQHQLLMCQASLQAQKYNFMLQSRCFVAWWQQHLRQQWLEATAAEVQARRNRLALAGAMLGWQQVVEQGQTQRQLFLRSEAYRTLMIMSKGLQVWRTWLTDRQLQRLKETRASQHWQTVVHRHVLACWHQCVDDSSTKWYKLANALCFHKHKLQAAALQAWQAAARQQQEANSQAVLLLQQWQQRWLQQTARVALQCWQQLARQQLELRQLTEQLVHILQQQRRRHVLQHWQSLTQYRQQLDTAAAQMASAAGWWWLQHCMDRWHCVVAAMAGRRSAELRELVLLRAVLGTWLKYTEQQRQSKATLAAASAALQQRRVQRLLAAWRAASDALTLKHQRQRLAARHYERRAQHKWLLQWQHTAADLIQQREQMAAAKQQHCRFLMARTLQGWSWYCWHRSIKRQVPDFYCSRLLLKMLLAWHDITAAKPLKQQRWRQAVRHHYLATLFKSFNCWQYAMQAAARQQQRLRSAEQHYTRQVQRRAIRAWQGPYVQQRRRRHAQLTAAAALHAKQQQRNVIRQWRARVSAQTAKRAAMQQAIRHMHATLLSKALATWTEVCDAAAEERQQLADAAAPAIAALTVSKQRRVLVEWRQRVLLHQQEQEAESAASAHWRHALLRNSLTVWQQYTTQHAAKATARQVAQQHYKARVAAAMLTCWRRHVANSGVKRQHMFAAAMHRRSWLACRAWRAWRLALALTKLELAAPCIAQQADVQAGSASMEGGQQRQEPCLDAVAAAVVAASCASQASWQQQWQKEWQKVSNLYEHQHAAAVLEPCSSASLQQQQQPERMLQLQHQDQQLRQGNHTPPSLLQMPAAPTVGGVTAEAACAQVQQSRPRRPPRLPAFMQSEQQQQQQPQGSTQPQFMASTSWLQQEQRMPRQAQLLMASPRRHDALRQQHAGQQPWHSASGSRTADVTYVGTTAIEAGRWSTLQVCRARLQPRQLQPSVVGYIPPVAGGQQQLHQHCQQASSLPGSCDGTKRIVFGRRQQQQEQHDMAGHSRDVQLLFLHHKATAAEAAGEGLAQSCRVTPVAVLSADAANWDATTPIGMSSSVAGLQGTPAPVAAAPALGYASMLPHKPAAQQHWEEACAAISSSVLQQQHQQALHDVELHLQGPQVASASAAGGSSAQVPATPITTSQQQQQQHSGSWQVVAPGISSSQLRYTPVTRQLLRVEIEAMERAVQLMTQLKAALHCRQQQAEALQHHIAALEQQAVCNTSLWPISAISSTDDTEGATAALGARHYDSVCLQQQDVHQLLQQAQQQLKHVESELCELKAEQEIQQPRLAGIAERIQQLKAAALGR